MIFLVVTVYVSRLPTSMSDHELSELLSQYGVLAECSILKDSTRYSKGEITSVASLRNTRLASKQSLFPIEMFTFYFCLRVCVGEVC